MSADYKLYQSYKRLIKKWSLPSRQGPFSNKIKKKNKINKTYGFCS